MHKMASKLTKGVTYMCTIVSAMTWVYKVKMMSNVYTVAQTTVYK